MSDIKKHYYGSNVSNYEEKRNKQEAWHIENELISKLIIEVVNEGETVLDLPVGTGRWFDLYKDKKLKPICIDISQDMIDYAREKAKVIGIDSKFIVKDVFLDSKLPVADCLVAIRFFNLINLQNLTHILKACDKAGVNKYIFTIRFIKKNANIIKKLQSKKHWLIRNLKDARKKKRKGHYFIHHEEHLINLYNELQLKVKKTLPIEESRGEILQVFYLCKNN